MKSTTRIAVIITSLITFLVACMTTTGDSGQQSAAVAEAALATADPGQQSAAVAEAALATADLGNDYIILGERSWDSEDRALDYYAMAIEANPAASMAHFKRGEILQGRGEYEEAFSEFRLATEADPSFAHPLIMLAHLTMNHESNDEALGYVERALSLNSGLVEARLLRASLILHNIKQGDRQTAMEDLKFVLEHSTGWEAGSAYFHIGNIERESGNMGAALDAYRRAIESNPDDTSPYVESARTLLKLGAVEDAERTLETAIERSWDSEWAAVELSRLYLELGRGEEALARIVPVLEMNPERFDARSVRGMAYISIGEYEAALADLSQYLEIERWDSWARSEYARALLRSGAVDEAEEQYSVAIDHWWDNVNARLGRAEILQARGELEAAAEDIRVALDTAPGDARVLVRAILLSQDAGQSELAEELSGQLSHVDATRIESDSLTRLREFIDANPDAGEALDAIAAELPGDLGSLLRGD